eukprot:3341051-Prymnesium_polylepis.2
MLRRFVLVGLMVLYQDTMMQLVLGTLLAAAFSLFQVQASPYINMSDDLLASSLSFCMVVAFLCSYAFKVAALTGLEAIQDKMSIEQKDLYVLDQDTLTLIMMCVMIAALLISAVIFVFQFAAEVARAKRDARANRARRLRYVRNGQEVDVPSTKAGEFHLLYAAKVQAPIQCFLSHVWGSGQVQGRPTDAHSHVRGDEATLTACHLVLQDQMRVVKTRLLEMLPDARVFLGARCLSI